MGFWKPGRPRPIKRHRVEPRGDPPTTRMTRTRPVRSSSEPLPESWFADLTTDGIRWNMNLVETDP